MTADRFKKGENKISSPYFTQYEFECPCQECDYVLIDEVLLKLLEALRMTLGVPVHITSGFRCDRYQYDLKKRGYEVAQGISTHQLGKAADISTGKHSGKALEDAARSVGFRAVGVGKTWVHVDTRDDKERRWTYSKR